MGVIGFLQFLFLAPSPLEAGCVAPKPAVYRKLDAANSSDEEGVYADAESNHSGDPVNFFHF